MNKMLDTITSQKNFCLDVYCSEAKKHMKRSLFPIEIELAEYQLYLKEEDNGEAQGLLYLFQKKQTQSRSFFRKRGGTLVFHRFLEKFLVTNLFRRNQETEFEILKSIDVNHYGENAKFNPVSLCAEIVVYTRPYGNHNYYFFDDEINSVDKIAHPISRDEYKKSETFRWVGEGRCCIAEKYENSFKMVDLKQKTRYGIDFGDDNRLFENTAFSMVYSTKNAVLFCEARTFNFKHVCISGRLKIVDFSSKVKIGE